jgi:RNA polymerase sigma factor (sigma-70 family)
MMAPLDRLARLDSVTRRLSFALDDHDAANAAFGRWRAATDAGLPSDAALEQIEVWAYCYVQRHALVRFAREPGLGSSADLDALISSTFLHVRSHLFEVRDAGRFTRWVAVACRNHFLTHCRRRAIRPVRVAIDPQTLPDLAADDVDEPLEMDRAMVHRIVGAAIGRLPEALRTIAQLRLVDRRGYDEIASAVGRPPATVRTYVAKAIVRLRADPELCALRDELAGESTATRAERA